MQALTDQNKYLRPFLKWAGGKRQLLPVILPHIPAEFGTYFEPFIGGGALLFALHPEKAVVGDINQEIVNCYLAIRDEPMSLYRELANYPERDRERFYYSLREMDRLPNFGSLSLSVRAARTIFLNHTGYNGLYRVNQKGQFNVPYGKYVRPMIYDEENLIAVSSYLMNNNITILSGDFEETLETATSGDFIYLDPPYDPVSKTANFTAYSQNGFGAREQTQLKDAVDNLTAIGCKVLISNSDTLFIHKLYHEYEIISVKASRAINSKGMSRGKITELLIKNY